MCGGKFVLNWKTMFKMANRVWCHIKSVPLIGKSTLEYERQRIKEKKIYIRCFLNSFLSFASGLFETVIIHGVHIQSSMIRRINVTKTIHN
jgi:hypothetical protein